MAKEEVKCDVLEKILDDLDTAIKNLQKVKVTET